MIRQARTGDAALVKNREMTGRTYKHVVVAGGGGGKGKDDRKQNSLALLDVGISHHHGMYKYNCRSPYITVYSSDAVIIIEGPLS
jgi:hypothetical protein